MLPCCHLTYVKYINDDGTIDEAEVKKAQEAHKCSKYYHPGDENRRICTCRCHTKGTTVLH
jgi:hypothetical protein